MIARVVLSSRSAGRYLACLAGCGAICVMLASYGLKIQISRNHSAVALGIPEFCAVLAICLGVIILRPRLWILDRLGVPARRWIPAVTATVATLSGPQILLALADMAGLPAGVWPLSATTTLCLAGLAVLSAPLLGALRTVGVILLIYLALTSIVQLAPVVGSWSPLATVVWPKVQPLPPVKVIFAGLVTAASLVATVRTLGRTMRSPDASYYW